MKGGLKMEENPHIYTVPQGAASSSAGAEQKPRFTATAAEGICALLSYILAALYIHWSGLTNPYGDGTRAVLLILAALLIFTITEILHWRKPRSRESWLWLACFMICTVSRAFNLSSVWYDYQLGLFIHLFAVWWILTRSDSLLEGETGHLLPLDGLNGFVIFPFSNFFLRIRTLSFFPSEAIRNRRDPEKKRRISPWSVIAVVISAYLLFTAASLLISADSGFRSRFEDITELLSHISDWIDSWFDEDLPFRFLLELPVGCWLFGLMAGTSRQKESYREGMKSGAYGFLENLKKVPGKVWTAVIIVFSLLYAAFFLLQGSYLFGAFTGHLPEGFIISQYAREGFFELCKVIAVNFSVLWLATRMVTDETKNSASFLWSCLIFLAESMLFAIIAFSKLYLYIHTFGFTPLRLQSTWLVCVCFAGCAFWIWSLVTGNKSFRKWVIFSAVTLCLLCVF